MRVFISGVSQGLGRGLAEEHLARGDEVWACSRAKVPDLEALGLKHFCLDLSQLEDFEAAGLNLPQGLAHCDLVWLNAGRLGELTDLVDAKLEDLEASMRLNVWANKYLVEALMRGAGAASFVAISSGASVRGNRGWSGYAVSKAALNMLVQLLAAEYPQSRFLSLAPGLVKTAMQDHIAQIPSAERFPSLERLKAAHGTENMQSPRAAARRLIAALTELERFESGSFVDIRQLGN